MSTTLAGAVNRANPVPAFFSGLHTDFLDDVDTLTRTLADVDAGAVEEFEARRDWVTKTVSGAMNAIGWTARYRGVLEAKRDELQRMMSPQDVRVEMHADPMDQAKAIDARDDAARGIERTRRLLVQVKAALLRMDRAEFGECLECEEHIPRKRLDAMPWADLCVKCQAQAELREKCGVAEEEEEGE